MALVSISKKRPDDSAINSCPFRRMFSIVVLDKFFLLGICAALLGSLALGVPLWLMRDGVIAFHPYYSWGRETHALIQFYLFLLPFILGFYIQSTPKLFETGAPMPTWVGLSLPGTFLTAVCIIALPGWLVGKLLISANCLLVLAAVLTQLGKTNLSICLRMGFLSVIGLLALATGPYWGFSSPVSSLLLMWLGIISIILATSQQFIAGVLGGKRASSLQNAITLTLFVLAALSLKMQVFLGAALLATATFVNFWHSTGFYAALRRWREPFVLGFLGASLWAIVGTLLIAQSATQADAPLHALALGYAVTLILVVSLRLTSWLTNYPELGAAKTIGILSLWHFFVIGRVFDGALQFNAQLVMATSICGALALLTWAWTLLSQVLGTIRTQVRMYQDAKIRKTG